MSAGKPSSVEVMIKDHTPTNQPPAFKTPSYAFELKENEDGRDRPVAGGHSGRRGSGRGRGGLRAGGRRRAAVRGRNAGAGVVTYTGAGEDYESEPNRYALTLEARDPLGAVATAEVTIQVTGCDNEDPSVTASCDPCEVGPGDEALLTAEATDPDGDPLAYRWSAPEGRIVEGTPRIGRRAGVLQPTRDPWRSACGSRTGGGGTASAGGGTWRS